MAPIQIRKNPDDGTDQLLIDGVDYSNGVFANVRLVEVGDDPEFSEVGVQITFAVSLVDFDPECLTADERPYVKVLTEVQKALSDLRDRVQRLQAADRRGADNGRRGRRAG